ncbi:MAG: DUF4349 domain-containing protein [Chloroflexi bacterium]|nr:DUF4349 domain-containing protein [Chloroflexota bacterium]
MTYAIDMVAQRPKIFLSLFSFIFAALMVVNCGGSSDGESGFPGALGAPGEPGAPGAPGEPGAPGSPGGAIIQTVVVEKEVMVLGETVVQTVVVERAVEVMKEVEVERVVEVVKEVEVAGESVVQPVSPVAASDVAQSSSEDTAQNDEISFQPQARVIVRNAEMTVQSDDPSATVDAIGDLANDRGGWIVDSTANDRGSYSITIRVPAEILDAVIDEISSSVAKVEKVNSTSADFTEEFIDLSARQTTVQETVNALTELLKTAEYDSVEELLEVQKEITSWQTELESIDGRLRFISQSANFSKLQVTVNLSPIPMQVDAGSDIRVGLSTQRQYTARFNPPEGYDRFEIVWDFGDGTPPRSAKSALRTQNEEGLLSVPVVHSYSSDGFSPYVVTVSIKAYSENGVAQGEDKIWAHVAPVSFNVDAGGDIDVGVHEQNQYTARFNPPEGYDNFEITWDFGNASGQKIVRSALRTRDNQGFLSVPVVHAYDTDRFSPYVVSVNVKASSDQGVAYGRDKFWVNVAPIAVEVDAGEDIGVGTNVQRQYTARFIPPEGYDRFEITWDFGDGTGSQTVYSALKTQDASSYLSAPVVHTYYDDAFSPYVVTVKIKASSDRGVSEGGDQLWAHVSELPQIEAYLSASQHTVEENQQVRFTATFNHPETVRNLMHRWDFRDGSKITEEPIGPDVTRVEIEHAFDRFRPQSYPVKFEIWGESDAGEVLETHFIDIYVTASPTVNSSEFEPGETATQGINVLVAFFTFAGTAAIWIATTSPIWLIFGAGIYFAVRFAIRRRRRLASVMEAPDTEPGDPDESSSSV